VELPNQASDWFVVHEVRPLVLSSRIRLVAWAVEAKKFAVATQDKSVVSRLVFFIFF
jgi:hypothetical protein